MPADLYEGNRMMYVGQMPWHEQGINLPANATWAEAKAAVGFYTALEREVFVPGIPTALPDVKALIASDDGRYLATVGKSYGVVQFDTVAEVVMAAAQGQAVFHTAGLLGENGARGWLLGELPNPIRVAGDKSETRKYFLASTSHDSSSAVVLMRCATRVVCVNTLNVALGEKDPQRISIRHTLNAEQRVKLVAQAFKRISEGYNRFEQAANLLARTRFDDRQLAAVLDKVIPLPEASAGARSLNVATEKRTKILDLAQSGLGLDGIRGTAWGAFQAFSEYADHHSNIRPNGLDPKAARLNSIWFGTASNAKQEAMTAIISEAGLAKVLGQASL